MGRRRRRELKFSAGGVSQAITQTLALRLLGAEDALTSETFDMRSGDSFEFRSGDDWESKNTFENFNFLVNGRDDPSLIEPIGGGIGYTDIVDSDDADYLPTDLSSFRTALNTAAPGEMIYLTGDLEIDLTGIQEVVPPGVLIASDRGVNESQGALLYSDTTTYGSDTGLHLGDITGYADGGGGKVVVTSALHGVSPGDKISIRGDDNGHNGDYVASVTLANTFEIVATFQGDTEAVRGRFGVQLDEMLAFDGTGIRMTGVRVRGPGSEIEDAYNFAGIRVRYGDCRIDNCFFYNCSKWAIDVYDNIKVIIECNLFYNCRRDNFGYGTWFRGAEPALGLDNFVPDADISEWNRNIAFFCRHECASGGQDDSSYKAKFNLLPEHTNFNHNFDRHDEGAWTEVKWNIVGNQLNFAFGGYGFRPWQEMYFIENYVDHVDLDDAVFIGDQHIPHIYLHGNKFAGSWRSNQPTCTLVASISSTSSLPVTVTYTATASDPSGLPINRYYWRHTNAREIDITFSNQFSVTYTTPGWGHMEVFAGNSAGLLSLPRAASVELLPTAVVPPATLAQLVEWWPCNELSNVDRIGIFNSTTFSDINANVAGITGKIGRAAEHTGGFDSGLTILSDQQEQFNLFEDDLTVLFKMNVDTFPGGVGNYGLVGTGATGISRPGWLISGRANGSIRFRLSDGLVLQDHLSAAGFISLNTDHHIAVTLVRGVQAIIYVDGVVVPAVASSTVGLHSILSQADFSSTFVDTNRMDGDVEEISVFRRALSATEIEQFHNSGNLLTYKDISKSDEWGVSVAATGADYTSIQDAIDTGAALIYVAGESFTEDLTLFSRDQTVIFGSLFDLTGSITVDGNEVTLDMGNKCNVSGAIDWNGDDGSLLAKNEFTNTGLQVSGLRFNTNLGGYASVIDGGAVNEALLFDGTSDDSHVQDLTLDTTSGAGTTNTIDFSLDNSEGTLIHSVKVQDSDNDCVVIKSKMVFSMSYIAGSDNNAVTCENTADGCRVFALVISTAAAEGIAIGALADGIISNNFVRDTISGTIVHDDAGATDLLISSNRTDGVMTGGSTSSTVIGNNVAVM